MKKRFTFFIEEYDEQASARKYYKIHSYGASWQQAFNAVELSSREDYSCKLLTLNQFNALRKKLQKPSLLSTMYETLLAFYPFKYKIRVK